MKFIVAILSLFLLSGCGTKFTGENVRELKYGISPQEVHSRLNSNSSCHMPFLLAVDGTVYRHVIYSTDPPSPSLNLLFKNGKLSNSVLENPKAQEIQELLNGKKINFINFAKDYNADTSFNSYAVIWAPFVMVSNIGQLKNDEILLNINLGLTPKEIINILGEPDVSENIENTTLYVYESGKFIGQLAYVFSIKNSRLESIIRIVYAGDFNKDHYIKKKNGYIELISRSGSGLEK